MERAEASSYLLTTVTHADLRFSTLIILCHVIAFFYILNKEEERGLKGLVVRGMDVSKS